MYRRMLSLWLAFALVLVSGGVNIILPVSAEPLSNLDMGTITMQNDFTDDAVMVVLTNEASLQFIDYTPDDFPELDCVEINDLSSGKGAKVQAVLRGEQLEMDSIGAQFMNQNIGVNGFRRILCLKLANPGKGNVLRAVMALEQREDVYSAEPNYIFQGIDPIETQAVVPPDDGIYGWAAEKIEQEAAWEIETGSSSVLVGVVDSGIDVSHPELQNRVNTTLSKNYVNDGYSATNDRNGHGTHVAGIIAAKHNSDELTFSGVCQNVTLVSLRTADSDGNVDARKLAEAINYAETKNIPILNLSLSIFNENVTNLQQAVTNYSGLIVCAAGNDGANINGDVVAPASFDDNHVVSVAASNSTDGRYASTNYGSVDVDLFAPGVSVLSCWPRGLCSSTNCESSSHLRYGYHYLSGTSMAAPFVTGVAALILAHNPNATPSKIKSIIMDSVDSINAFSGYCVTGGRLNALNALSRPGAHYNTNCSYKNASQHLRTCVDCGLSWSEDHVIHPGLGTCMLCNH